jgi:hypothetical protein
MNAWRAPQRVVAADCPNQIADVGRDRRPADTTARLPTPVQTEAAPMPAHQRLRLEEVVCVKFSKVRLVVIAMVVIVLELEHHE